MWVALWVRGAQLILRIEQNSVLADFKSVAKAICDRLPPPPSGRAIVPSCLETSTPAEALRVPWPVGLRLGFAKHSPEGLLSQCQAGC